MIGKCDHLLSGVLKCGSQSQSEWCWLRCMYDTSGFSSSFGSNAQRTKRTQQLTECNQKKRLLNCVSMQESHNQCDSVINYLLLFETS